MSVAATAEAAVSIGQTGREDAEFTIAMLGPTACKLVPPATSMYFGQWLGWPDWLRDGTSLTCSGPLPSQISLANDLILVGNIIDHGHGFSMVERMLFTPRPAMGTVGSLSLMHAPEMGVAVQNMVRVMVAQNPFLIIRTDHVGDETRVVFEPPWPMGPLFRFVAIAGQAMVYRALEAVKVYDHAAIRLGTQLHDDPAAQSLLAKFRCVVGPSSGSEYLSFPRHWEASANPFHDPLLWAVAQAKVGELERDVGDAGIVKDVCAFIVAMLEQQQRVPRIKQASAHLGVSSRTIMRLLGKHGTSFHRLVDDERKLRAITALADQSMSISEIAKSLGFSDVSSFGRAVRKWFGDTPSNLRKAWSRGAALVS
jgi:AraC-like DNA-binding protein